MGLSKVIVGVVVSNPPIPQALTETGTAMFTQEDVDNLKSLPDSGDWRNAEGYGSINDGPWFRSLIERLMALLPPPPE